MWQSEQTKDPDMDQNRSPDLGGCDRAKKRKRGSPSSAQESKRCKMDTERCNVAKRKRSASGAPETHHNQPDLGGGERATKRKRSADSAQENKRYKLDCSGTSGHKKKLQASGRRITARSVEDKKPGHLICKKGDVLNARYEVVAVLGQGIYGKVVECIDHKAEGRHVAVKIAKNIDRYSRAARDEIQVLQDLKASDPSNAYHCVQMLGWFEYRGHVCIVFELLGLSTFDFMRHNDFLPFSLDDIRHMAYQICTSVNFLHMNNLTHTDLKPDNIVFVRSDYVEEYNPTLKRKERRLRKPDVRLVDFGCAKYDYEYHGNSVTARAYRAPEVVLELGWSHPCDVWSIGCTLLELYLGDLVFQTGDYEPQEDAACISFSKLMNSGYGETDEDLEHLAMMERLLGPLPEQMISRVFSLSKRSYFYNGQLDWDEHSAAGQHVSRSCKPLKEYMTCYDHDHENLFDLIEKMLQYDPAKRITLAEALEHPFFLPLKQENSS